MSSDLPSDVHSPRPEPDSTAVPEPGRAAVVATLGAALVEALEQHLPGARDHAEATGAYAFAFAVGLDQGRERSELIRETAKLHDVGMVYVPVATLRKPADQLDPADATLLASHIEAGARLALGAGIPEEVGEWILKTRERFDGAGPEGIRGTEIPLESRIIRVACAVDLMLGAAGRDATVAGLRAAARAELDPGVVETAAATLYRVAPGD